jgi:signal transduction histidine kinase
MRMVLHLLVEGRIGPLSAKQHELVVAARDDSDRLHQIIENLMDMARIESGRVLMETQPVPVAELVLSAIEPLQPAFAEHGVSLEVDLPARGGSVLADPTRVGHVFANLLNNALKYTQRGGHVRVSATERAVGTGSGAVEFAVADDGAGIPRQYLGRLFEKFFRAPGQPGDSGTGLGLAIVKDIVDAHGGRVTVESEPGSGTTFRFTLPVADSESQPQATAEGDGVLMFSQEPKAGTDETENVTDHGRGLRLEFDQPDRPAACAPEPNGNGRR